VSTSEKDRNQAARQQLLKKREQSQQQRKALAPGEMVDDALARAVASGGKWLRANGRSVQLTILGLIVAGIAYAAFDWWQDKRAEAATSALVKAELDERGRIGAPESKSQNQAYDDDLPVFKSIDEKRRASLSDYRAVISKHASSGAAILARLGEAGVLLDQRDFDGAVTAFRDVKSSKLAAADISVRARAIEGVGLALEGKKDVDAALAAFRELENSDARGYRELGMFQQARILAARADGPKGDVSRAVELLKNAREKLRTATVQSPFGERPMFPYVQMQVDDLLRSLDPTAIPVQPSGGASRSMTPEQRQRLLEEFQRRMQEAKEKSQQEPNQAPAPGSSSGSH
jgi:hypothetical protein